MGNCAAGASRSRSRHAAGLSGDGAERVPPQPQPQLPEREEKGGVDDQVRTDKGVEVKIRITRRQLRELLEKAGGGVLEEKVVAVEKMLADIVNAGQVVVHRRPKHGDVGEARWRPALRTIPEEDLES